MTLAPVPTAVRYLGAALLGVALGQPVAHAASGSYQGIIDDDSGLGLIGQTMRVDFAYDQATLPSSQLDGLRTATFDGFLTSMQVTIGGSMWSWSPTGYSSLTLYDNSNLGSGIEDRINAFVGTFTGPSLVAMAVMPQAYSFDLYLFDSEPLADPDGLSAYATLPAVAPNPNLFHQAASKNTMVFSFFTGDIETGNRYSISTADVSPAAPVPEASAALMLLAGLGVAGAFVRLRRGRRS